jgi:hypothetical protein
MDSDRSSRDYKMILGEKVQVLIRGYENTSVISHVANDGGNV